MVHYSHDLPMTEISTQTLEAVPMPTGPNQVGTVKFDVVDAYRKDFTFPAGRLIPIQIYFPKGNGSHTLSPKLFEERASIGHWEPLQMQVYSKKADLSSIVGEKLPLIFLNHGSRVPLSDYSFVAEDLASHGYVVVSIQHDLTLDAEEPPFWEGRSCSRNAKVIDNMLYVFEWLKTSPLQDKINFKRVGFIGHSFGANSMLPWINRELDSFKEDTRQAILPRKDQDGIKECFILMEATRFSFALNHRYPLFFLLAEERESHHKKTGCCDQILGAGHELRYYKGSTHISFMDHGYICPPKPVQSHEFYFQGTLEERKAFFDQVREDIRTFLKKHLS